MSEHDLEAPVAPRHLTISADSHALFQRTRLAGIAAVALLGVSLVFRFLWLDTLPGVNGDEAWYGVQVSRLLEGQSWAARTPSGVPVTPLLWLTEAALLKRHAPSFWILRMPIALWAVAGIVLTFRLHDWVFKDRTEAALVAALTACLPAHLAYSRMCLGASFSFVSAPLVLYAVLHAANGQRVVRSGLMFGAGALFTTWAHLTHGLFVAVCFVSAAWLFYPELLSRLKRWLNSPLKKPTLARSASEDSGEFDPRLRVGLLFQRAVKSKPFIAAVAGFGLVFLFLQGPRLVLAVLIWSPTKSLQDLWTTVSQVGIVGDLLLGPRVFEFMAGVPRTSWVAWLNWPALALGAGASYNLYRRGARADRALALIALLTVAATLLVAVRLRLNQLSCERYILYLVPLAAVFFVRGSASLLAELQCKTMEWTAVVVVMVGAGFLAETWRCYFAPLCDQTYQAALHRTLRSGLREPKAAAAELIQAQSAGADRYPVCVEDWWIQHPLQYLLGTAYVVEVADDSVWARDGHAARCFVGFSGSAFVERARLALIAVGERFEEHELCDSKGRPIVTLLIVSRVEDTRWSADQAAASRQCALFRK